MSSSLVAALALVLALLMSVSGHADCSAEIKESDTVRSVREKLDCFAEESRRHTSEIADLQQRLTVATSESKRMGGEIVYLKDRLSSADNEAPYIYTIRLRSDTKTEQCVLSALTFVKTRGGKVALSMQDAVEFEISGMRVYARCGDKSVAITGLDENKLVALATDVARQIG